MRVHDVQGAGHLSPFRSRTVSDVPGIVTATRRDGFFMQDPAPDLDPRTSEGIFVATTTATTAGDAVTVSGRVAESRDDPADLTVTRIQATAVTILSRGNRLPASTIVGGGGRRAPTAVIENDASDVESGGVFDPDEDAIDLDESLEGMLVQVNDAVVVGPRTSSGEAVVLADGGAGAGPRTARGGILLRANDPNPERMLIDDEVLTAHGQHLADVDVGDRFAGALVGVVDYHDGNFTLELLAPPTVVRGGLPRGTGSPAKPGELAVATFNVENLSPKSGTEKFDRLAALVVTNLASPDLLALEEVQDNDGPTDDGVVDASRTYAMLVAAIRRAGGPAYEFRDIAPENGRDGGQPGGNIRVGFLFRTDRGLAVVDRPGGDATTAVRVVAAPDGPHLSASPGRIDPLNRAFATSRKPLAAEFTFAGARLFVVVDHFIAKLGDDPLFGHRQPPVESSEAKRVAQTTVCADFVRSLLSLDPNAKVIVLGDLNDFEYAKSLGTLATARLHDLVAELPEPERYTYVFDGNAEVLDHILVSDGLFGPTVPRAYEVVHVNAEYAVRASDHDPQVARFAFR